MLAETHDDLLATFANQSGNDLILNCWQNHSHETEEALPFTSNDLVLAYWQTHCQ